MMTTRYMQKLVVVFVLLTCTSLLYLNQSSSSFQSHPLPQNVGGHHYPKVSRGYSVKPLVYIFPQYYTFPDNDRLHGANFTEWVNVKKVTHNDYGLETIRPHESIGFYNGLELKTRRRYGQFLRDYGFHGAVFHHYWFAGRPVMEHVIQAMLEDGEPNIPFMLSWANEPWSARWDGKDGSGVLIAQEYGLQEAWRKHFDWLLPFFKHPQYIRSEGKVQFVVYNPQHVGHLGPHMWAAFRQWAVEEGLGGMDIIETRWGDDGSESWRGHPPDAINEFHPHVAGRDHARYSSTARLSRVYHRGTLACWDTTPRHPTDRKAVAEPFCHPKPWKWHLVEMFQKIKSEPNPIGVENFLFVNALNEWGEGNSLEPSAQFGDGYGIAMKEAIAISEKEHVWFDTQTEDALARNKEIIPLMNQTADVCVLVRTSPEANAEDKAFKLTAMLRSLKAQDNQNWRAVVVQTDNAEFRGLDQLVLRALDPRVRHIRAPQSSSFLKADDGGYEATDWFIRNLTDSDHGCATAKYLLVTEGGNTYEPHAFDSVSNGQGDLIGLNVESRQTLWNHAQLQDVTWNDTCTRLENPELNLCNTSMPTLANFDLSATFINFTKFLSESYIFSTFTPDYPGQQPGALAEFLTTQRGWSYTAPSDSSCHVYHNPAYTSCLKTGNFWFDSPHFNEQGCYRSDQFINVFGPNRSPNLKDFDLQFYRENGYCVRYKEKTYHAALKQGPQSTPTPTPTPKTEGSAQPSPKAEDKAPEKLTPAPVENKPEPAVKESEAQATSSSPPVAAPAVPELRKDEDESEADKEFAPGAVAMLITSPTSTVAALPLQTTPSIAKIKGNDGGSVR